MTGLSVSNLSVQSTLTTALQAEQSSLTTLSEQLSTLKQHDDLTDYSASDARNLINLQSTATQKQAYIAVIGTVSNNLSIYNATLTDLETLATQAQSLANNNPTYSADAASNVLVQVNNYLKSATVDLNQEVNGRYIYSGSRYNTTPVSDLTTLPASTLSPTITTDPALPSYDSQYSASTITISTSGNVATLGGTVTTGQVASVVVDGTTYSYTAQASDTTPGDIATGLNNVLTTAGVTSSVSGANITIGGSSTLDGGSTTITNTSAYAADSAVVDTNYTVNYGITSNDPAIQQLVAGMRYLQAAGKATDSATYTADMAQASSLLTSAVTSLQNLNTGVANNINIMTSEKTSQTNAIDELTTQVDNIQQVDVTQVSTEITSLQTILQASYAVTGDLEKMSIVSYLPS